MKTVLFALALCLAWPQTAGAVDVGAALADYAWAGDDRTGYDVDVWWWATDYAHQFAYYQFTIVCYPVLPDGTLDLSQPHSSVSPWYLETADQGYWYVGPQTVSLPYGGNWGAVISVIWSNGNGVGSDYILGVNDATDYYELVVGDE